MARVDPALERRYRIIRRIGGGAFGTVYLAETLGGLNKQVAIKVLHPDKQEAVGRLRDEARILAMVRHRSIVRVDELLQMGNRHAVVMEYVDGPDLLGLLQQGPIPFRVAATIAAEIASALHAAWQQSGPTGQPLHLLHRDIKPANIKLTRNGEVKLLDFGVARADFLEKESATTKAAMGTIIYMAQERFEGRDLPAGDVYALGVTLFEMLWGVPPGTNAMDPDREPPGRNLRQQWQNLRKHPALFKLLVTMLAREPEDRPSAKAVAEELEGMLGQLPGPRLSDWTEQMPEVQPATVSNSDTDLSGTILGTNQKKEKGGFVAWLGAGAGLLGLVLLCGGSAGIGLLVSKGGMLEKVEPQAIAVGPVAPPKVESEAIAVGPVAPPNGEPTGVPDGTTPSPESNRSQNSGETRGSEDGAKAPAFNEGIGAKPSGEAKKSPAKPPVVSTNEPVVVQPPPPPVEPPPPVIPMGTLKMEGDTEWVEVGGFPAGHLPVGNYTSGRARYGGREAEHLRVVIEEGKTTTIRCDVKMTCVVDGPK